MSEVTKEICRRILVKLSVPDPTGRVMTAMQEAFAAGEVHGSKYGWQPDQGGGVLTSTPT